jgi:uncharacterized protein
VVEKTLETLAARADGPFVSRLPREPGRRESRYAHLFSGAVATGPHASEAVETSAAVPLSRLERLEEELRQLRIELDELKARAAG